MITVYMSIEEATETIIDIDNVAETMDSLPESLAVLRESLVNRLDKANKN